MDIITGTNLKGKNATVFCSDKPRRAVGPVFESKDEAEKFVSFLGGVDPTKLGWGHSTDTGELLLVMWAECGCPAQRPVVQFNFEDINYTAADEDSPESWSFVHDLVFDCFPLFTGATNHDITEELDAAGVFTAGCDTDSEAGCSYFYFNTEATARAFIERFNGWLRDNWFRAYKK